MFDITRGYQLRLMILFQSFSPTQNQLHQLFFTSSAQELERKAKETKNMDEWRQKCGSAVWKDPPWRCDKMALCRFQPPDR